MSPPPDEVRRLMGTEIERKFLVRDVSAVRDATGVPYRQGYLSTVPERTVRVRVAGEHAFITIKGTNVGATRAEFEYEIPLADAQALLRMCLPPLVEKTRYRIDHGGLTWEVDVFEGENDGLVVAEVELPAADTPRRDTRMDRRRGHRRSALLQRQPRGPAVLALERGRSLGPSRSSGLDHSGVEGIRSGESSVRAGRAGPPTGRSGPPRQPGPSSARPLRGRSRTRPFRAG